MNVLVLQLKFEEDLAITRMFSAEGEDVPFCELLYPTGNVEDWLLEVERVMRLSLKDIIEKALNDYPQVYRVSVVIQCSSPSLPLSHLSLTTPFCPRTPSFTPLTVTYMYMYIYMYNIM